MLPTSLGNDNRVCQPPWVMDLPDEVNIEHLLDLFSNEILPLNGLLPRFLLDRSGVRVDLQMMLNHLPWDLRHA
jgi:hypothetical protein